MQGANSLNTNQINIILLMCLHKISFSKEKQISRFSSHPPWHNTIIIISIIIMIKYYDCILDSHIQNGFTRYSRQPTLTQSYRNIE